MPPDQRPRRRRVRAAPPGVGSSGPTRQLAMLAPEDAAVLHLVRANLELLREIANRYEFSWLAPSTLGGGTRLVECPKDIADYLRAEMEALVQEQLRVVLLDSKHRIIAVSLVYQGSINATAFAGVGDCFREALRLGAAAIVLVHNHPSGDPAPSPDDVRATHDVAKAGELLGVELLDHVVIGRPGHASLLEQRLFTPHGHRVQSIGAGDESLGLRTDRNAVDND